MTAMMAFFSGDVALFNVTDDDAKEMVANYFNPINLAEATSDRKRPARSRIPRRAALMATSIPLSCPRAVIRARAGKGPMSPAASAPRFSESELFHDPYSVLAELAAELDERQPPSAAIDVSPGESGEPGLARWRCVPRSLRPGSTGQTAPQPRIARADGDGSTGPRGLTDAGAAFPELGPGEGETRHRRSATAVSALRRER